MFGKKCTVLKDLCKLEFTTQSMDKNIYLRAACHESLQLATEIEKHQDTLHASTEI